MGMSLCFNLRGFVIQSVPALSWRVYWFDICWRCSGISGLGVDFDAALTFYLKLLSLFRGFLLCPSMSTYKALMLLQPFISDYCRFSKVSCSPICPNKSSQCSSVRHFPAASWNALSRVSLYPPWNPLLSWLTLIKPCRQPLLPLV